MDTGASPQDPALLQTAFAELTKIAKFSPVKLKETR